MQYKIKITVWKGFGNFIVNPCNCFEWFGNCIVQCIQMGDGYGGA